MENIVNLAKNRGFVYAGSEIYGWLANTWDYGPYGSQMKENIKNLWLKEFVQKRTDMVTLDAGILMNPQVWVASGHVWGFSDPLIDDKKTGKRFRADKLLEDHRSNERRSSEKSRDVRSRWLDGRKAFQSHVPNISMNYSWWKLSYIYETRNSARDICKLCQYRSYES